MRIGILGGTFDPVHLGHLVTAEQCREQAGLDQVWFMPSAQPPHKQALSVTAFEQRLEMLQLAIAGHSAFRADPLERELGGLSYTVRTLEELHRRNAGSELFLILGADSVSDLPMWREPARILAQASLLVVPRPGFPLWTEEHLRQALNLPTESPAHLEVVQVPLIDISSRDLRQRVGEGRSIRYLVPRAVECYIEQHGLYVNV